MTVSICCVTYNHINYIRKCLDGFVNQKTNFKFEILVHDDASTDGTSNVVKEYEVKYPHLFRNVYQVKNQFLKQNVLTNILFKMAKGKYIALCEGDDYWTDDTKLQKQVDFMEANLNFSMCFHDVLINAEYSNGNRESVLYNRNLKKDVFTIVDILDGCVAHTSSFFFRSDLLNPLPIGFDQNVPGDIFIALIMAGKGKIKSLDFTGSVYRLNDSGISINYQGEFLYETKIRMLAFVNSYFERKYEKSIKLVVKMYRFELLKLQIKKGHIFSAIKNFKFYIKPF